jgi:hypothetical protein
MRTLIALALLTLTTATAHALPSEVKVLAQFDLGFAKCEARFPNMKGHRDDAYLALYKAKPDAAARAELAKVRKSEKYKQESQAALKLMDKSNSPEIDTKIRNQCEATWAEMQRNRALAKP